jgi:hypothetical protein
MGTFDAGIFGNDLSMDVRGYYEEFLEENDNDHQKAYKELIRQYRPEMTYYDASDKADFWFAVAEIQMQNSVLSADVKSKCMKLLTNKNIFELWGEDEDIFNERIEVLTDFVKRLKATDCR